MRKLMILLVCSTLAFGASSCKKNGECVCTVSGVTVVSGVDMTKAQCNTLDDAAKASGGSCKLK